MDLFTKEFKLAAIFKGIGKIGHDRMLGLLEYYIGLLSQNSYYSSRIEKDVAPPKPDPSPKKNPELTIPEAKGKDRFKELDKLLRVHGLDWKSKTPEQKEFYEQFIEKSQEDVMNVVGATFDEILKAGNINPEIIKMMSAMKDAFSVDPENAKSCPMMSLIEAIKEDKIPYDALPIEVLSTLKTLDDLAATALGIDPKEFADKNLGMKDQFGTFQFPPHADLSKLGIEGQFVFAIQQMFAKEDMTAMMTPGSKLKSVDMLNTMLAKYSEMITTKENASKDRAKLRAKDYEAAAVKSSKEIYAFDELQGDVASEKVDKSIIRHDKERAKQIKELGEEKLEQRRQMLRNQEMAKKAASGEMTEEQLEVLDEYHKIMDEVADLMDVHRGINNDKKRDHGYWRHEADNQAIANYAKDEAKMLASLGNKLKTGKITFEQYKAIRDGVDLAMDEGAYKNRPISEVYAQFEQEVVEGKAKIQEEKVVFEKKEAIRGTMTKDEWIAKEFAEDKDRIKFDKQLTMYAKDIDKAQEYLNELAKTDPAKAKEVEMLIKERQVELEADARAKAGFKEMVDKENAVKRGEPLEAEAPEVAESETEAETEKTESEVVPEVVPELVEEEAKPKPPVMEDAEPTM